MSFDISDSLAKFPMGPKVRNWLNIDPKEYTGSKRSNISDVEQSAFQKYVASFSRDNEAKDENYLIDLMDEFLGMDMPLLVLKLADDNQRIWQRNDFRGLHVEGLAAMISADLGRAELCFRQAQELEPSEPAPYVNLSQIMHADGRWEEALEWLDAGLNASPNHYPLWDLLCANFKHKHENYFEKLLSFAKEKKSWAGMSLASELDPNKNQESKAFYLGPFYHSGERSTQFLLEYTGALGASGEFEKIPSIVWQAEKISSHTLPWQLSMHQAQAHLAMNEHESFFKVAEKILKNEELPSSMKKEIEGLINEVREEISKQ